MCYGMGCKQELPYSGECGNGNANPCDMQCKQDTFYDSIMDDFNTWRTTGIYTDDVCLSKLAEIQQDYDLSYDTEQRLLSDVHALLGL